MDINLKNIDRKKYSGLRIGDTVNAKGVKGKDFGNANVVDLGYIDENYVQLRFEDGTELKWLSKNCTIIKYVEDYENILVKRPNLSFLTKMKFHSMEDFLKYKAAASNQEKQVIDNAILNIPVLITIAEMFFDTDSNKKSIYFNICAKTLNSINNN